MRAPCGQVPHNVEAASRINLSLSFLPANKSVEYRERWLTKAGKTALIWTKLMTKSDTRRFLGGKIEKKELRYKYPLKFTNKRHKAKESKAGDLRKPIPNRPSLTVQ